MNRVLKVSYATNVGNVYRTNEDNYFVDSVGIRVKENENGYRTLSNKNPRVFAVCDGMGGESYGEEASRIAVNVLLNEMENIKKTVETELADRITKVVNEANDRICDLRMENNCGVIGTTLALVCVHGQKIHIYSLGDSKVFIFENGVLRQISEDQTVAARKVKANIYTEEEARHSPDFSKLTSYVGVDDRRIGLKPKTYDTVLLNNQTVMLCSDGITDVCENEEISAVLAGNFMQKAEKLVNLALRKGSGDNITCIVLEMKSCLGVGE